MDQLIFASLSHTHYWYEIGMLKVPACLHSLEPFVFFASVCGGFNENDISRRDTKRNARLDLEINS